MDCYNCYCYLFFVLCIFTKQSLAAKPFIINTWAFPEAGKEGKKQHLVLIKNFDYNIVHNTLVVSLGVCNQKRKCYRRIGSRLQCL